MRKLGWLAALLCVLALTSASCSSDSSDDADSDTPGDTGDAQVGTDADDTDDDTDDDTPGDTGDAQAGTEADDTGDTPDGDIQYNFGVDYGAKVIRVGVNTDQTGRYATLANKVIDGHSVYWQWLNDRGGIQGWTVEPVIYDNGYDVAKHIENYDIMAGEGEDSVVMFSHSLGSSHTAAIAERLVEDQIAAVPLTCIRDGPIRDRSERV